jgi:hypothetical protein
MNHHLVLCGMETTIHLYAKNLLLRCIDFDMMIEELYQLFLLEFPQCSSLQS